MKKCSGGGGSAVYPPGDQLPRQHLKKILREAKTFLSDISCTNKRCLTKHWRFDSWKLKRFAVNLGMLTMIVSIVTLSKQILMNLFKYKS